MQSSSVQPIHVTTHVNSARPSLQGNAIHPVKKCYETVDSSAQVRRHEIVGCIFFKFVPLGLTYTDHDLVQLSLAILPGYKSGVRGCPEWRLGGITVKSLDVPSKGREFDSKSGRYQVPTTWISDCLWTGKQSCYVTSHQSELSFSSFRGKLYIVCQPKILSPHDRVCRKFSAVCRKIATI